MKTAWVWFIPPSLANLFLVGPVMLLFVAAVDGGFWLTALALANSALSLVYSSRLVAACLQAGQEEFDRDRGAAAVVWISTAGTVLAGLAPFLLLA